MWSRGLCGAARCPLLVVVSVSRVVSRIAGCELHMTFRCSQVFEPLDDVPVDVPGFTFRVGNERWAAYRAARVVLHLRLAGGLLHGRRPADMPGRCATWPATSRASPAGAAFDDPIPPPRPNSSQSSGDMPGGLRCSEVVRLRRENVSLTKRWVLIAESKGERQQGDPGVGQFFAASRQSSGVTDSWLAPSSAATSACELQSPRRLWRCLI